MAKERKECSVVDCTKTMNAREMCKIHYNRYLRANRGADYMPKPVDDIDYEDYWDFVKKEMKLV